MNIEHCLCSSRSSPSVRDELEPSKVGVNCYEDSRPQSQGLGMISVDQCPTSTRGEAWAVRSPVASHERSRTSEYRLYQLCEYRHYAAFQVHRQVRCKHGFSMHGAVSVPYFLERPLSKIPATPMLSNLGSPYRDATRPNFPASSLTKRFKCSRPAQILLAFTR